MSCSGGGCIPPSSILSSDVLAPSPSPSPISSSQSSSLSPPPPPPARSSSQVQTTLISSPQPDLPPPASPPASPSPSNWRATPVSSSRYWAAPGASSTSVLLPGGPNAQLPLESLQKCTPCGKSSCSFTPIGTSTSDLNVVVVGNPVANCQPGNNQVVTTKYLAAMDIEESWSTDLTLGFAISGLNIGGTSGWSKSRTITASQEVELIVVPGQMGALVANVSYKKTTGKMWIDSRSASFMSIQPQTVLNYAVQYADCGSQFKAFTIGSANCSTGTTSAGNVYATPIMPMFLMLLSILWFVL